MYGSKYRRKRSYKRKTTTKRTKKGNKSITRAVKRVLHSQIENKQTFAVENLEITSEMDSVNLFNVIPQIEQGIKQGQRVGNRVKVISLKLGVSLTMVAPPYTPMDTGRTGVYFDFYVFKVIQKPSYDLLVTNTDLDYFLQSGNAFNRYVGAPYNGHQYINKDRFNILYKKRFLMNNNFHKASASEYLPFEGYGQNTNSAVSFDISLTKNVLKNLKFQDQIQNPTNDAIYAVCVSSNADNTLPLDATFPTGQVSMFSQMVYEDA